MTHVPAPKPPDGHGLLEGKVVVVTAAAGTGIGNAVAERCLAESAHVVLSDSHERRLAEASDRLSEAYGKKVLSLPCDVTDEEARGRSFGTSPSASSLHRGGAARFSARVA